jgi:putative tryptophan/tyrosine transport system substrate-binding protein
VKRRDFITLLGGAAVAWPLDARAKQPERVRLIAVLMNFLESDPAGQVGVSAFRNALKDLGWREGSDLRIEIRWAASDPGRLRTFAKELVELRPDAIVGGSTAAIVALARETRTIPIVFATVADPIGSGFAASFAHPGGNITGFAAVDSAMGGKWLELLKEIAPRTERVALLFNPVTAVPVQFFMPSIQAAASSLAVQASAAPVHAKDEIEGVIAAQARNPGGGLIVMPDAFNTTNRNLIIGLAARYGVPTSYAQDIFAQSGGLIAYSSVRTEAYGQVAGYIDRILKGEKPADLPVQSPTKFELLINMKTAKALGLEVPAKLLALANKLID